KRKRTNETALAALRREPETRAAVRARIESFSSFGQGGERLSPEVVGRSGRGRAPASRSRGPPPARDPNATKSRGPLVNSSCRRSGRRIRSDVSPPFPEEPG